ncbi:MAG: Na/Pi cotransporter family protein [Bacteroidales bacterium]|jgi:phosphate:Na+ symporter|nr:Na/Pi cotransporter family protein [Bacteroidales bacterium]
MKEVWAIISQILILLGSLGVFLFGMKLMSDSLQKLAGQKMRLILSKLTSNRLKGILTGCFVTSVIQSSSATTVMVVSFVNAGLLSLVGAVSVIMGANIGTTVTAWLISLLGFKFSITSLALVVAGLTFFLLFSKNNKHKTIGEFIIGFVILFIGLELLKDSVPDINSNPQIVEFLSAYTGKGYWSVLLFVLIGTILTAIIQSSSATMALTLVMAYNGWIDFQIAAAMVLGENIGTTITANIAAVMANTEAKRSARTHFIFNVIGVIWMLILFYPVIDLLSGVVIRITGLDPRVTAHAKDVLPISLSLFHTCFNLANTGLLVGFTPQIAKLATKMVKSKQDDSEEVFKLTYIDKSLFTTDELSLVQTQKELMEFSRRIIKMYGYLNQLVFEKHPKDYNVLMVKIAKYEEITDQMEEEIATYLSHVSEGQLSHQSSLLVRSILSIVDDMESVADVIFRMSKMIEEKDNMKQSFTEAQLKNLAAIRDLTQESINVMDVNLSDWEKANFIRAVELEESLNNYRNRLKEKHVESLKNKEYKFKLGTYYSQLFIMYEKIGDYIFEVSKAVNKANSMEAMI